MGVISFTCFLVNNRLMDWRLLRLDSFLPDALDTVLIPVEGRVILGVTSDLTDRRIGPDAGDMAPSLAELESFIGMVALRLGNRPNWPFCRIDMDEPDRGDVSLGEKEELDKEE